MSNVKKNNTEKATCGANCSCGCPKDACHCKENKCQCGCQPPASGK